MTQELHIKAPALERPADWKNYDDFATGIATNRLPQSTELRGRSFVLSASREESHEPHPYKYTLPFSLHLNFKDASDASHTRVDWQESGRFGAGANGEDACDIVEVAPHTYFIDLAGSTRPDMALTVIMNTQTGQALLIRCRIMTRQSAGAMPRVAQDFLPAWISNGKADDAIEMNSDLTPHETRELIGLRTWQTYSPEHTYEHTYLSSARYAWQCLVGVQRGQGDVDLASYYKFAPNQYIFTFREFLIPVASVFFFNFDTGRSTGKFLGLTGDGVVSNSRAGAFMQKASQTFYPVAGHNHPHAFAPI